MESGKPGTACSSLQGLCGAVNGVAGSTVLDVYLINKLENSSLSFMEVLPESIPSSNDTAFLERTMTRHLHPRPQARPAEHASVALTDAKPAALHL